MPVDFPDPDVVVTDQGYVAFATNSSGRHVQMARSSDLLHWTPPSEALPALPGWMSAQQPDVWAPDVFVDGNRAVMAFAGREAATRRMCIGLATATGVDQSFTADAEPLVCPTKDGGAIDPAFLVRGDEAWLYWKVDGNCCRQSVSIMVQQFDRRSLRPIGQAVPLLSPKEPWEDGVIEAPDPVAVNGVVYLLYSGGSYAGGGYGVGLARCEAVTGPCARVSKYPLFGTRAGAVGPGGTSVFTARDGSPWIAYHAWSESAVGYASGGVRSMRLDRVELDADKFRVLGPT